jgi:hypothetical protein
MLGAGELLAVGVAPGDGTAQPGRTTPPDAACDAASAALRVPAQPYKLCTGHAMHTGYRPLRTSMVQGYIVTLAAVTPPSSASVALPMKPNASGAPARHSMQVTLRLYTAPSEGLALALAPCEGEADGEEDTTCTQAP